MCHCVSPLAFFAFNLQVLCCLFTHAMTYLFLKGRLSTPQVSVELLEWVHVRANIEQQIRNLCMSYDKCVIALLVSNSRYLTARLVRARYVASRSFVTNRHYQRPSQTLLILSISSRTYLDLPHLTPTSDLQISRINLLILIHRPNSNVRYNYPKTVLARDMHRSKS
jgi:hypothetical protein